jgi:hypothetical protein
MLGQVQRGIGLLTINYRVVGVGVENFHADFVTSDEKA